MAGETRSRIAFGPERRDALGTAYRPFRYFSADGLALAGRDHGADAPGRLALLCLPGLTRNVRDFEPVAARLSAERRVIGLDLRGRGASEDAPSPESYNPAVEAQDVATALDVLGLDRVAVIGTSRGGMVAMVLALAAPGRIAAAILNDIGPEIELAGLLRIKGYVGNGPAPADWDAAAAAVGAIAGDQFPRLDDEARMRLARRLFRDVAGRPVPDYDPALARGLDALTPETAVPTLWPGFEALAAVPVMVLRGSLSDILSETTLQRMAERHPGLDVVRVPDEGHAPLLDDAATLDHIAAFLARADAPAAG